MIHPVGTILKGRYHDTICIVIPSNREGFYKITSRKGHAVTDWSHYYINNNWTVISTPNKFLNNFI